jgi:hypothetical protein
VSEPCSEKHNIEKLFDFHDEKMKQLNQMEIRQVRMDGNIEHIKSRIDNGMSHTIANLNTLLTKLEPIIGHHSRIIGKIEDIGWWISRSVIFGFVLCLVGLTIWAVANGFKPPHLGV